MKTGLDFQRDTVLADGTVVSLRMVRPSDAAELHRQFMRLSPGARYRRFLSASFELSEDKLRYLTEVDGTNHVAIIATTDSRDLKTEVGLGIGRFVRLSGEPEVAEPAVTVVDDAHHRGLGRLLLSTLAEAARERGIHIFRAEVLEENTAMRHLLTQLGTTIREDDDDSGALVFDIELNGDRQSGVDGDTYPSTALWRIFRLIAQSLLAIRFGWRK